MKTRTEKIKERLNILEPTELSLIDNSEQHAGHAGAQTGMGHYTLMIASPKFKDKNMLECHRMVYQALGEMMQTDIHALSIKIL